MDRKLLETLTKCIENNSGYFNKFITNSGRKILVIKYPYTNFELKLIEKDRDLVLDCYPTLGPFDCFNMIEELMVN